MSQQVLEGTTEEEAPHSKNAGGKERGESSLESLAPSCIGAATQTEVMRFDSADEKRRAKKNGEESAIPRRWRASSSDQDKKTAQQTIEGTSSGRLNAKGREGERS